MYYHESCCICEFVYGCGSGSFLIYYKYTATVLYSQGKTHACITYHIRTLTLHIYKTHVWRLYWNSKIEGRLILSLLPRSVPKCALLLGLFWYNNLTWWVYHETRCICWENQQLSHSPCIPTRAKYLQSILNCRVVRVASYEWRDSGEPW